MRDRKALIDFEAHPRDLEEDRLTEIEDYELKCLRESKEGLRLNGRLVLAMIREIRAHREARTRKTSWQHLIGS